LELFQKLVAMVVEPLHIKTLLLNLVRGFESNGNTTNEIAVKLSGGKKNK